MNASATARRPLVATVLVLSTLGLAACGAAGPAGAPTADDRYREVQRHEATIARSRALVVEGEPECAPRCRAVVLATRAADDICALAVELAEEDAQARCRRGRATVDELRAQPAADCVCDAEPRPGATSP